MKRSRIPKGVPYFLCPKAVLEDRALPKTAQLVFMHLQCYAGDGNNIYPSVETLAKRMGKSSRTIQLALVNLEAAGWVYRKFRNGRSTIYIPTVDPARRADVSFRNQSAISARRETIRNLRPNHHSLRRHTQPPSGESENKFILPGMKSRSPNQESYQEQPNKKIGGKKNAQGLNKGCSREGEKPSVDRAVPNPDTTWDELSQAAILLLPSVAEVDIHEWLIDLLECVAKKHPILKGEAGYLQGLVRNALTDLSDELSHQSEGQHKKPHEIVDWVFGWIDRYGNSE